MYTSTSFDQHIYLCIHYHCNQELFPQNSPRLRPTYRRSLTLQSLTVPNTSHCLTHLGYLPGSSDIWVWGAWIIRSLSCIFLTNPFLLILSYPHLMMLNSLTSENSSFDLSRCYPSLTIKLPELLFEDTLSQIPSFGLKFSWYSPERLGGGGGNK